jgi:multidrug efflux pump subunit AcrB
MRQILAAFARNTVFANIALFLIFLAGGIAANNMIREFFPEFSLGMITISVPYPGADPEEVEEGICRKIEEAVDGLEGVKQYTTKSSENIGTALVEIKENYDLDDVLDKVRTKVNAISTFPVDAERPVISELTINDPVLLLSLSGNMSERGIKEWAETIKEEIKLLPEVSKVEIFGSREYEISIGVSEKRLREYGLTLNMVADAVRRSNLNLAGGTIRTSSEEIRVRTIGRRYTGAELASIIVLSDQAGSIITLDRIATINDGFSDDPITAFENGEPCVMLTIYKTQEDDSLVISDAIHKFVKDKSKILPKGANIKILYDMTDMLRARINLLIKNGILGLIIVFLLLWIFLNARLSLWAGMGIPISIAGALVILWAIGGTINMISLFGLIMVLGIVVDDAIIVGEAIYVHRKQGKAPLQAAVDGIYEVGLPVIAAITTSIVAFLPLLYVGGIMGKFISILPTVVISCLIISLVECLFLLPAHLSQLPEINGESSTKNPLIWRIETINRITSSAMEWFVRNIYTPFLKQILYYRYVCLCAAIAIFLLTVGMFKGGILKFEVIPDIDGFIMTATVEFPDGTPPDITQKAIDQINVALMRLEKQANTISGDPLIENRISLVGQTLEDMPQSGPHLGSVQAILLASEKRGIHSKDLMIQWEKEIGPIPGARSLTFSGLSAGPPGAPIEVWIQGHNMPNILTTADDLMERLRKFDGVYQISSDFSPGKNEIQLKLRPEAQTLGFTVDDLARQIRSGYYGNEAIRLQRGRDDIRVKIRYTEDERGRLSDLKQVRIRTKAGEEIPLLSVADLSFEPGYSTITRTDGLRCVTVNAEVDTNIASTNEILSELSKEFFQRLKHERPDIQVAIQGEQKNMRESFSTLMVGFPMALIGIFIIIATIFRSYIQPFVIMFTVPFGIIGAVLGHLLMGYDFSMMSIFGMVALTGVVVNDAIVLIERINKNLAEGMPFIDAIIKGGARRFRPIVLTTVSTIGGLSPLIMEADLQAKFLIPMALSIAAGVAFATLLTLVLIPSLLMILNDIRLLAHRLFHGTRTRPVREDLEPSSRRDGDLLI